MRGYTEKELENLTRHDLQKIVAGLQQEIRDEQNSAGEAKRKLHTAEKELEETREKLKVATSSKVEIEHALMSKILMPGAAPFDRFPAFGWWSHR